MPAPCHMCCFCHASFPPCFRGARPLLPVPRETSHRPSCSHLRAPHPYPTPTHPQPVQGTPRARRCSWIQFWYHHARPPAFLSLLSLLPILCRWLASNAEVPFTLHQSPTTPHEPATGLWWVPIPDPPFTHHPPRLASPSRSLADSGVPVAVPSDSPPCLQHACALLPLGTSFFVRWVSLLSPALSLCAFMRALDERRTVGLCR